VSGDTDVIRTDIEERRNLASIEADPSSFSAASSMSMSLVAMSASSPAILLPVDAPLLADTSSQDTQEGASQESGSAFAARSRKAIVRHGFEPLRVTAGTCSVQTVLTIVSNNLTQSSN
jgi:hypothetical protein